MNNSSNNSFLLLFYYYVDLCIDICLDIHKINQNAITSPPLLLSLFYGHNLWFYSHNYISGSKNQGKILSQPSNLDSAAEFPQNTTTVWRSFYHAG